MFKPFKNQVLDALVTTVNKVALSTYCILSIIDYDKSLSMRIDDTLLHLIRVFHC